MANSEPTFIIVGKIGSPYGVRGWVKIISYTEDPAAILRYRPWYIGHTTQPTSIVEGKSHHKGMIAKLPEVDTPEAAKLLTHKEIAVLREQLPVLKPTEYYWHDLIGLTIVNQHQAILGRVIHLIATGSNDVLIVKGEKEHAIPYLSSVIQQVDLEKKTIFVNWDIL